MCPALGRLPEEFPLPDISVLNALAARYVLLPRSDESSAQQIRDDGQSPSPVGNVSLIKNANHFPRAWIVRNIEKMTPLTDRNPSKVAERTKHIWFPNGRPRDLRGEATVETDVAIDDLGEHADVAAPAEDLCHVVELRNRNESKLTYVCRARVWSS